MIALMPSPLSARVTHSTDTMSQPPQQPHSFSKPRPSYAILKPPSHLDPSKTYNATYFNSLKPPPNYIPGISRGAIGFTTRSDLGPLEKLSTKKIMEKLREEKPLQEYTQEDQKADELWNSIEEKMKSRRKRKRNHSQGNSTQQGNSGEGNNGASAAAAVTTTANSISTKFADLKTSLRQVTPQEWLSIPDSKDSSIQRRKFETYTAVPDTLVARAQQEASSGKDLKSLGEAKISRIQGSLQKLGDSVSGQTNVDTQQYMSGLATQTIGNTEISDLKRARDMMKGLTTTNPTHAPGWIARARVEELAGKMSAARSIITEACEKCSSEEDVWLEAARLHPPAQAKSVLAEAATFVPQSARIWIQASELEETTKRKKLILRKALNVLPQSLDIWKEAIELEEDVESARLMLQRAVECLPTSVDMSLALARLEDYSAAKKVLNQIRKRVPNDPSIWIAAAQLEESVKQVDTKNIINKSVKALKREGVPVEHDLWISFAKQSEDIDCLHTCRAIIGVLSKEHQITKGATNIAQRNLKKIFIEDAQNAVQDKHMETARAIYDHAVAELPKSKGLWKRYIKMEQEHGSKERHIATLQRALEAIPDAELLWLNLVKVQFRQGAIVDARASLEKAFKYNAESDLIWLAAVAVEMKTEDYDRCEKLLQRARKEANSAIIWMKSAIFYRNLSRHKEEKSILDKALTQFQDLDKLWIMRGQWEQRNVGNNNDAMTDDSDSEANKTRCMAAEYFQQGLKFCPKSPRLWLCAIKYQMDQNNFAQARALIDQSKLYCSSEYIWLMSVRVERASDSLQAAEQELSRGMQELPHSGVLWREHICFKTGPKRKAQAVLAVRECEKSAEVFCVVANIFWEEHVFSQARTWFNRALKLDYDNGDTWIQYYAFEQENGNEETLNQMMKKLESEQPTHGEKWCNISKDPKNHALSSKEILLEAVKRFDLRREMQRRPGRENVDLSTYCVEKEEEE